MDILWISRARVRQNVAALGASASVKLHGFAQHVVVRHNVAGAREVGSQTPWLLDSATKCRSQE